MTEQSFGNGLTDEDEAPPLHVVHFTSVAHCSRCGAVCALCAQTDERRIPSRTDIEANYGIDAINEMSWDA